MSLNQAIASLRSAVDDLRLDLAGLGGGKLSIELSALSAVSEEAQRLALECAEAIDHLLAAEVSILQRVDSFEDA